MFNAIRIRDACGIEQVEVHDELDSTNDRALELVRENKVSDTAIIVTQVQHAGRGQRGNSWWSSIDSLTFTWIKNVSSNDLAPCSLNLLPLATGLSVATAIESTTKVCDIKLKWPNDLLVDNRKLAGILIETVATPKATSLVVGIGVNANQNKLPDLENESQSPEGWGVEPTSIKIETGTPATLESLLISIVNNLFAEFDLLFQDPTTITSRCNQRLAFLNEAVKVEQAAGQSLLGVCQGVATDGSLLVLSADGDLAKVFSGTVRPAAQ